VSVDRPSTRSAGVPSKTIRPPSWPAPGPRSMIQSACAITAWWCSMTTTDFPESTTGHPLAATQTPAVSMGQGNTSLIRRCRGGCGGAWRLRDVDARGDDQVWLRLRAGQAVKPTARELRLSPSTVRAYLLRCGGSDGGRGAAVRAGCGWRSVRRSRAGWPRDAPTGRSRRPWTGFVVDLASARVRQGDGENRQP